MAYAWTDMTVGLTPVTTIDDVQKFPVGTRKKAFDATYGEGEFIYLPGVAATAVGSLVVYDTKANTTTLTVAASRGPVAVAMAAVVAANWGWYQIRGAAVVKSAAAAANAPVFLTAAAGTVDDLVAAGQGLDGAVYKTADGTPSAGLAVIQIAEPCASGAV